MAEPRYTILPPINTPTSGSRYEILPPKETGRNREQFLEGSYIREFGEGVGSGTIGIFEGILGAGAMVPDYFTGSDYGDKITAGAEALRDYLGFDPEGIVGKGAEVITQYVVPGLGVASKVGKVAMKARQLAGKTGKMTKGEKRNLALKELAAVTGAEMAVSGDNTTTIGDWVEAGPTQSSDLVGLDNSEKAAARFANRLRIGAEAGVIGGVLQAGLGAAGKTIGDAQFTKNIAAGAKKKIDQAADYIDNELVNKRTLAAPGEEIGVFKNQIAQAIAFSRYRGSSPAQVAERRLSLDGEIKPQLDFAERVFNNIDNQLNKTFDKLPDDVGSVKKADALNNMLEYMTAKGADEKAIVLKKIPSNIRDNTLLLRNQIDVLSKEVVDGDFLSKNNFTTKDGRNIKEVINDGIGSYVKRSYKIHEDAKYVPDAQAIKTADEFFISRPDLVATELTDLARKDVDNVFNQEFMNANGLTRVGAGDEMRIVLGPKVTPAMAQKVRESFLGRHKIKNKKGRVEGGRTAKERLQTSMFLTRTNIEPELRALLGEVDDPRAAVLGTVTDLSQFVAVDKYYGDIAKMAKNNTGIGRFFKDGNNMTPLQQQGMVDKGYVKLGGTDGLSSSAPGKVVDDLAEQAIGRAGWGSLDGFYVPEAIYKDLTNYNMGSGTFGTSILRGTLNTLLKAKGISQYSKTVLSPITQVRNFTTAITFALANGNMPAFGRGSNFLDSLAAVTSNVRNKGDEAVFADLADALRRGVLGTNAELREIQDQLNKGIGYATAGEAKPKNFIEAIKGKPVTSKLAKGVGSVAKGMENLYQASDDIWKYFSYNSEQAKLRHALDSITLDSARKSGYNSIADQQIAYLTKNGQDLSIEASEAIKRGQPDMDDLIKNRAAQIVKDTVPNYNKGASELIQLGRKLPFGNFITFPAEIYRNSFNIVRQGLDDMASDIPAVRKRGIQRLMGFVTTTAVLPAAALEAGHQYSGVSREEMEAFKRSFGAPWMMGSTLIPTGRTEDGKIKYINYSVQNPYDVLSRFANRAITEIDAAIKEGKDVDQVFVDVGIGTLGEAFAPFLDEAMLTDALLDISYRGGKTSTGAQVYNPEDPGQVKVIKMAGHVADTMIPNILKVADISGGKVEASRFLRGVAGDGLGIDAIAKQDKMGRERTWKKELRRLTTGISEQEFDPKQGLRFAAYGFQQGQTDAKRMFNKLTDDFNVDSNQLLDGFTKANEAKFRNDRGYYRMIEDLRIMGVTDGEIRQVLKQNNIGGIKGIMRGKFEPFKLTAEASKKLRRVGRLDQLPRSEIQRVRESMRDLPLDPRVEDTKSRTSAPTQVAPRYEVLPPAAPAPRYEILGPEQQGSLPLPQAPVTQARAPGPVNPALLGDNPFSSAANAQIAARLQQT